MIYRFIIENFASFSEASQFDMFPNPKRTGFPKHIYPGKVNILKECAIYGANGSGKSNFIKALRFIKDFATSFSLDRDEEYLKSFYHKNRFKLPPMDDSLPISFVIEFSGAHGVYIYMVDISSYGVEAERLYLSGLGSNNHKCLFKRSMEEIAFADEKIAGKEISNVLMRQLKTNNSLSALSIIGKLSLTDNVHILDAYQWFEYKLEVIDTAYQVPWLIEQLRRQSDVFDFVRKVFSEIGIGMKDLKIKSENFEEWITHADTKDRNIVKEFIATIPDNVESNALSKMDRSFPHFTLSQENGIRTVSELFFYQLGMNGYVGEMGCETQSKGTLRLLTLVPAIYSAVYEGKTVVIDEIDNSIHPMLIKELITYFGSSDSTGQLIFTTHETALLNQQELLRPDEVWFMEKVDGMTKLYSLNDFKIHHTISIENGYLTGRFGAIPFIGNLKMIEDESGEA